MPGPFENKTICRSYNDVYDFAVAIFNKAVKDIYRVRDNLAVVRSHIINFESPERRNKNVYIDNARFYMDEYCGRKVWVGVVDDIKNGIFSYRSMMDGKDMCIFIEDCNVSSAEGTIHTVKIMKMFLTQFLAEWFTNEGEYSIDRVNSFIITHLIANYLYREFGINLSIKENFMATLVTNENSEEFNDALYDAFVKDFEYVSTIYNGDMDIYKLRGSPYRFTDYLENLIPKTPVEDEQ